MKLPLDNWEKLVSQENKITGCATSYFLSRTALLLMCLDRKRTSAELETCCCNYSTCWWFTVFIFTGESYTYFLVMWVYHCFSVSVLRGKKMGFWQSQLLWSKVHSILKQCLHDLQLTQFGGTFTKPFRWCQLRLAWKVWWKYLQIEATEDRANKNGISKVIVINLVSRI